MQKLEASTDNLLQPVIKCTKCGEEKELPFFVINKRCKLGVERTCRTCKQATNRKYIQKRFEETGEYPWKQTLDKHKEYCKNWRVINHGHKNSLTAKYRATRLNATPPWADLKAIQYFYDSCPEGYHVDHIIPLQGKVVSGLHVQNNLRVIPATLNLKKSNKYDAYGTTHTE